MIVGIQFNFSAGTIFNSLFLLMDCTAQTIPLPREFFLKYRWRDLLPDRGIIYQEILYMVQYSFYYSKIRLSRIILNFKMFRITIIQN